MLMMSLNRSNVILWLFIFIHYCHQAYKENLQKLQNLVLVKFENDTMVEPTESEWFGFYKPGQAKEIQTLQQSDLYLQVCNCTIDVEMCYRLMHQLMFFPDS